MAEFIETPYATIALAAAIPAVLYYFGLYAQVDLIAGKGKFERLNEVIPQTSSVMREGWHFLIPFAVLLLTMFYWESSPEVAAISSSLVMFVVGMLRSYKGRRLTFGDSSARRQHRPQHHRPVHHARGRGLCHRRAQRTGLSFALTLLLVKLAGANLFLLLAVGGGIGIVLGMGMPTTAVYILLATLIAPSIWETGIPKLAAHMFGALFRHAVDDHPAGGACGLCRGQHLQGRRDGNRLGGVPDRLGEVCAAVHVRA